MLLINKFKPWN